MLVTLRWFPFGPGRPHLLLRWIFETRENLMQLGSSPVPVVIALIVAVIGMAVLFGMDFGLRRTVRNDGINQSTRAALARAGATEMPTPPNDL
jgi:hypothetical protein